MDLHVEQRDGLTFIRPSLAYLDASNASEFKRDLSSLLDERGDAVLDLCELQFVDSSGIGALLVCLRKVRAVGGDLKLCSLSSPVRSIFEIVRLHRLFEIYNDREEVGRALPQVER